MADRIIDEEELLRDDLEQAMSPNSVIDEGNLLEMSPDPPVDLIAAPQVDEETDGDGEAIDHEEEQVEDEDEAVNDEEVDDEDEAFDDEEVDIDDEGEDEEEEEEVEAEDQIPHGPISQLFMRPPNAVGQDTIELVAPAVAPAAPEHPEDPEDEDSDDEVVRDRSPSPVVIDIDPDSESDSESRGQQRGVDVAVAAPIPAAAPGISAQDIMAAAQYLLMMNPPLAALPIAANQALPIVDNPAFPVVAPPAPPIAANDDDEIQYLGDYRPQKKTEQEAEQATSRVGGKKSFRPKPVDDLKMTTVVNNIIENPLFIETIRNIEEKTKSAASMAGTQAAIAEVQKAIAAGLQPTLMDWARNIVEDSVKGVIKAAMEEALVPAIREAVRQEVADQLGLLAPSAHEVTSTSAAEKMATGLSEAIHGAGGFGLLSLARMSEDISAAANSPAPTATSSNSTAVQESAAVPPLVIQDADDFVAVSPDAAGSAAASPEARAPAAASPNAASPNAACSDLSTSAPTSPEAADPKDHLERRALEVLEAEPLPKRTRFE